MSPAGPRAPRRWLWPAGLGAVIVLGVVAYLVLPRGPGNVSNPGVEFTTKAPPPMPQVTKVRRGDAPFDWPVYGYDKARTRVLEVADPASLHPPYAYLWSVRGTSLLEFPPVLGRRSLYMLKNNGALYAIVRRSGAVRWKRKIGALAASSPAYAHGYVYAVLLRRNGGDGGLVTSMNASDGTSRWTRRLPSRAESSPLIDRGRLYFGTENGTVYCLDAANGHVRWTYQAHGAVKGGIALDGEGNLYFGDYAGHVQSVRKRDGHLRWDVSVGGTNFYSTPAVAFDRVYLGGTDGLVYSFGASTGRLAWRHQTGAYVYGSPAVGAVDGSPPTVYVGSYDSNFYALDARTGRPRWIHHAEGRISGGSMVIGDMVFYSTLSKTTTALGVHTGRVVWTTRKGAFNPVVSDGRRLYLVGYSSLFGLKPIRPNAKPKPKPKPQPKPKPKAGARPRPRPRLCGRRPHRHRCR